MYDIEYVGGPTDGEVERVVREKPAKGFTKRTKKPIRINELTGEAVFLTWRYELISQAMGPQGYILAKYLLREQSEESVMLTDLYSH